MNSFITRFIRLALPLLFMFGALPSHSATPDKTIAPGADCVILLHGLARTYRSMAKMENVLLRTGYRVANIDYPSRKQSVEALANAAVSAGIKQCKASGKGQIHFVTHSLGGILVRYYLSQHDLPELGRVVMLAPPNQGSEVVDGWRGVPGFSWLNGPAGNQLGTDANSITRQLGPVTYPVGIIAGTRSINLILSLWLPNPDDGKVSVESTKVDGMTDFMTYPVAHPFIARNDNVIEQVASFLATGKFDRAAQEWLKAEDGRQGICIQAAELNDCGQ